MKNRLQQLKMRLKRRCDHIAAIVGRGLIFWAARESNMLRHARDEWAIAFPPTGDAQADAMQADMGRHVMHMTAMFAVEGHSGFSAAYAQTYITKALRFEPFSPLTGAENEWAPPFGDGEAQQNKRCGRVFRAADGQAYDIDGRVFEEPDGARFTSRDSRVPVTFPYLPKTEIVQVAPTT